MDRDTCRKGRHPWVPENIYINPRGDRNCRICQREACRRYQQRTRPERHCDCGRTLRKSQRRCDRCAAGSRKGNYEISDRDRACIYKRDGGCLICGETDNLTIDHVLPRALGGLDLRSNYQTLCAPCNSSKGATYADHRKGSTGQLGLPLQPSKPTVRDRFMAKVEQQPSGCWLWTGARVSTGNGAMNVDGRLETASRVSHRLFIGEVPAGMWVYRNCGNKGCVAPEHVFADQPGRQQLTQALAS